MPDRLGKREAAIWAAIFLCAERAAFAFPRVPLIFCAIYMIGEKAANRILVTVSKTKLDIAK
jgi:hypothetical protein